MTQTEGPQHCCHAHAVGSTHVCASIIVNMETLTQTDTNTRPELSPPSSLMTVLRLEKGCAVNGQGLFKPRHKGVRPPPTPPTILPLCSQSSWISFGSCLAASRSISQVSGVAASTPPLSAAPASPPVAVAPPLAPLQPVPPPAPPFPPPKLG